jgi:outer membrane protein assembly factor BamB
MRRTILALTITALSLALSRAGDWTQFRGTGGAGVSDEKNLPVKWSATDGLRWKAALPGRGLSNPIIAGDRVFLTACSGYREGRLHVLCFDTKSGKKLWERQFASTGNTSCHPMTCMAAPTPVTDGKNVYALFATADLIAFDRDGNLLWYRSLAGDYPNIANQVGMASSPVLYKDVLLVPMDNVIDSFAAGIDARTGQNCWKVARPRSLNWMTPVLVKTETGRVDAVFQNGNEVLALDPETGKVRWQGPEGVKPSSMASSAPGPTGVLIMTGSESLALKLGAEGQTPEILWKTNRIPSGYCTPVYHEGRVYGLTDTGVNCVDMKTGQLLWQQRAQGKFAASPILADGKLYAVNQKGLATVIKLGDKPEVLATNNVDDTILGSPAVAGGAIFMRSDGWLYCIGAK